MICVEIEVPRGAFVKRAADGALEVASPLPCPFDYGSIVGTRGPDGDPLDALVLGTRSARGDTLAVPVRGVVRFLDAGVPDDKWICGRAPTAADRLLIRAFFTVYGLGKRLRHPTRRSGVLAWEWAPPADGPTASGSRSDAPASPSAG